MARFVYPVIEIPAHRKQHLFSNDAQATALDFEGKRQAFDQSVRLFLAGSLQVATGSDGHVPQDAANEPDDVESVALVQFFETDPSPLSTLLRLTGLQHYLVRPLAEVEFTGDAYEPVLSKFEQRIYNLASKQTAERVPFRYIPSTRQDPFGDAHASEPGHESLVDYFNTRRADEYVYETMTRRLEVEVAKQTPSLPVHTENRGGTTVGACLQSAIDHARGQDKQLECYVIQQRHGYDRPQDLHFGVLLALIEGGPDPKPLRLIHFDPLRINGKVDAEDMFRIAIDNNFQVEEGVTPVSAMMEDGGVDLWRPNPRNIKRHQDIDCSFHTFTIARALIQIACQEPETLLQGSIPEIRTAMTARMPEYFIAPNVAKSPTEVRETGIALRWSMGQEALEAIAAVKPLPLAVPVEIFPVERLPGAILPGVMLAELLATPPALSVPGLNSLTN